MSTFLKKHPLVTLLLIANTMLFMYKMYIFVIILFSPMLPFFLSYLLKCDFMSVESYKKLSCKKISSIILWFIKRTYKQQNILYILLKTIKQLEKLRTSSHVLFNFMTGHLYMATDIYTNTSLC